MKQRFWPIFSRIIEQDKRQGKSYKGIQGLLTSFNQAISSFLQDVRNRETMFSIKGYLPGDKKYSLVFFRIIEYDKPRGTKYRAQQGPLTILVEVIRSNLRALRGC